VAGDTDEIILCCVEPGSDGVHPVLYEGNTFTSDCSIIHVGGYTSVSTNTRFVGNTLVKGQTAVEAFETLDAPASGGSTVCMVNDEFVGTIFENGATLRSPGLQSWREWSYSVLYRLQVRAEDGSGNPITGATVSVVDGNEDEVATGETDTDGYSEIWELPEFTVTCPRTGAVYTEYNNYTVTTTYDETPDEQEITLDEDTVVTAVFS